MPDIISLIASELESVLSEFLLALALVLPKVLVACLTLVIGWLLGRLVGKAVALIVRYGGIESAISETVIGRSLRKAGYTVSGLVDLIARVAIYLFSLGLAIRTLGYEEALIAAQKILTLVGQVISGALMLLIGVAVVEKVVEVAGKVAGEGLRARMAVTALHAALLAVVVFASLSQMGVDVTPAITFLNAVAWGLGLGLGGGLALLLIVTYREDLEKLLRALREAGREQKSRREA